MEVPFRIPDVGRRVEIEGRVQRYMRELVLREYGGQPPWSGAEAEALAKREHAARAAFAVESYKRDCEPLYRAICEVAAMALPVYELNLSTGKVTRRTPYTPEQRKQVDTLIDHIEYIATQLYGIPFTRPNLDELP